MRPGDIVVAATDGLFDNVYPDEAAALVTASQVWLPECGLALAWLCCLPECAPRGGSAGHAPHPSRVRPACHGPAAAGCGASCCLPLPPPPLLLPALTGPPSPCPPARLHPAPDQQERGESAHAMAVSLAQFARMRAGDPTHLSPFAYGAQQLGYRCVGEEVRQGGHGLARLRGLRGAAAAAACSAWRGQAGARLPASTRPLPSLHPSARSTPPLPSRPASYFGGKLDDITVLCGVVTPVEDGTGGAGGAPASNGAAPAAKM